MTKKSPKERLYDASNSLRAAERELIAAANNIEDDSLEDEINIHLIEELAEAVSQGEGLVREMQINVGVQEGDNDDTQ